METPRKKRYRTVMLGCGGMSGVWLENVRDYFKERVEIVGYVDLNAESAARRSAEFSSGKAWTGASLETALQELKPDVLFNCTVPDAHFDTCLLALEAGCHVLVEKPIATTVAQAAKLVRLSEQTGRKLAVIQNRRYLAGAKTAQRALADGVIGPIHTVCVDFFIAPRFGGFRETMESPLLLDMAIHTFDQGRFLTGLDPVKATCREFNPPGSWFSHGASAMAIFEMTRGVVMNYRGSWCAQGFPTAWAGSWRIIGEKGTLLWDGETGVVAERIVGGWDKKAFHQPVESVAIQPALLTPAETGHAGNLAEFLACLDSGRAPQTAAADNIRSLAMVEAAISSARSGNTVVI